MTLRYLCADARDLLIHPAAAADGPHACTSKHSGAEHTPGIDRCIETILAEGMLQQGDSLRC